MVTSNVVDHKAPIGEMGVVKTSSFRSFLEDNKILQHPHNIGVYSKMTREDAQVNSIIRAMMLPIQRATWRIDPAGADDDVVQMVSEDLRLPIVGQTSHEESRGRVSWREHLPHALQMLVYGHAYFEKVFEVREDGTTHLRKIAVRPQETIQKVNVEVDGGLKSIVQRSYVDGNKYHGAIEIPVERLLAYVYDDRRRDWLGQSVLRPAYLPWMYKLQEQEVESLVIERNGMGIPVYTASPDADDDEIAFGQELVESLRSGSASGASINYAADLSIKGVSGQIYSASEAINRHNGEIAKAVLAHALNLDGRGGSYALAETQMGLFIQSLETIASQIADTATHYLIEDMVYYYTGDKDAKAPKLVFDEIGMQTTLSANDLSILANSGVIFTDKVLDEHVRRQGGLPPRQDVEEWAADVAKREEVIKTLPPEAQKKLTGDTTPSGDSSAETPSDDGSEDDSTTTPHREV